MIKLLSISKDGGNARLVWLSAAHVISVESEDGVTLVWLTGAAQVYVDESVERVVELVTAAK